jgi:hypothetical protein
VLFKNFHLSKRVTASIRVQCDNITSTPHFGQPNTNLGNVNSVGVYEPNSSSDEFTSVLPSSNREGELGLRINC